MSLTPNSISAMLESGAKIIPNFQPVIQVLSIMRVANSKRIRLVISDGRHSCVGILTSQNNHYIADGAIEANTILKLNSYSTNPVKDQLVIVLLSFDVRTSTLTQINNPVHYYENPVGISTSVPQSVPSSGIIRPQQQTYGGGYNGNNNANAYNNRNTYNKPNPYSSHSPQIASNPIVRTHTSSSDKPITPISSLNMYQNRWTIKARVTNKNDIRHWSNSKGEGKLFSVDLLDSSGTDIRATFFKEAVDKFYDMLETDKVYTLAGGRLKAANMQYNTCKSDFEITFDQNSEIAMDADTGEIQEQIYELRPIAELESVEPNSYVDVIGIVKSVGEPGMINSKKTGKEIKKCELTLGDDSGAEVTCTIWGERSVNAPQEFAGFPVVAFRRARVSDFGGRTLSGGSGINIHPRIGDAQRIQTWWDQTGSQGGGVVKSLTSSRGGANRFPEFDTRKSVAAIKNEHMGQSQEKPDYVSFKGTFTFIKSDRDGGAWYTACMNANDPCKNRVKANQGSDGLYHCERCNNSYQECIRRYIFSATVSDGTSTTWVSVFDDQAQVMFNGMTADELYQIMSDDDKGGQDGYEAHFAKANHTDWVLTCKVKQETHQDETRTKTSIQSIHPVDYAKEGRSLLNAILSM